MRRAVMSRDRSYDGVFFICVRTTGVFCRPSCPARRPREKNTVYRAAVVDCLLGGFRPCKRCQPLALSRDDSAWLSPLLRRVEQAPHERITDTDLTMLGVSPYRARRYFQRNFQMTFQAYHRARRMGMALVQLHNGHRDTAVAYDQGFESLSGFRDAFKRVFGTTPGRAKQSRCIHTARLETPLGPMVAGAVGEGLCFLEFADRRAFVRQLGDLQRRFQAAVVPGHGRILDQVDRELKEYFAGNRRDFSVPLVAPGSEFQEKVWSALRRIPFGTTTSYADLARRIGHPQSVRAVGRANGDNRIAIVIPCHRVVRSDGTLCGYGGGRWRKQFLLDLEGGIEGRA
jgi:AraC family transcriptional regulator of adaptative response/methylated-DNA-[protein]-cysteine methyltransferase